MTHQEKREVALRLLAMAILTCGCKEVPDAGKRGQEHAEKIAAILGIERELDDEASAHYHDRAIKRKQIEDN